MENLEQKPDFGQESKEYTADKESLEKIKKLKQNSNWVFIVEKTFFDSRISRTIGSLQQEYQKKYPDLDFETFDEIDDNPSPPDYKQAVDEFWDELNSFVEKKSDAEILNLAKETYELRRRENLPNSAYNIAKSYLDNGRIKTAAQEVIDQAQQQMESGKEESEKVHAAFIISNVNSYSEAERDKKTLEKSLEIQLESNWLKEHSLRPRALYNRIRGVVLYLEDKGIVLPKNDKVLEFAKPFIRDEVSKLINTGRNKDALKDAELYFKHGFLDLEKDSDLFETLTKEEN